MKTRRSKRKNKYTELRAAIAAVQRINNELLRVLPQWRYGSGGETQHSSDRFAAASPVHNPPQVKENVTAFFREHGKDGEEAVAAFLDALARFSFDEFPRNWPEVWRMVYSSREIQWRLKRHFPDNAFFDRVFHEEMGFFKAITPTARKERSRAYWELLRKVAGYSRRVLARMGENAVRSLEGERLQPVCLAEIGDGALRKIREAMGGEARRPRRSGRTGSTSEQAPLIATATRLASLGGYRWHWTGGTAPRIAPASQLASLGGYARTRRGGTDGEGRRGRQTEYMAKQRKAFLDYLKIHPETASTRRQTRALECWRLHRREWESAAKKGIGYSSYKALANASLM